MVRSPSERIVEVTEPEEWNWSPDIRCALCKVFGDLDILTKQFEEIVRLFGKTNHDRTVLEVVLGSVLMIADLELNRYRDILYNKKGTIGE